MTTSVVKKTRVFMSDLNLNLIMPSQNISATLNWLKRSLFALQVSGQNISFYDIEAPFLALFACCQTFFP